MGPRVTVLGRFERVEDANLRRRYLARHPQAALYADFPDFSFWRLSPTAIHGVAGFGRIETLTPDEVFPVATEMEALEMSAIEHMNNDHAEAIHLYATKILKAQPGPWRVLAIELGCTSRACGWNSIRRFSPQRRCARNSLNWPTKPGPYEAARSSLGGVLAPVMKATASDMLYFLGSMTQRRRPRR